jgi:CarboxypepD_reg-like domain/TonB-dependent Receptor Plug Domain
MEHQYPDRKKYSRIIIVIMLLCFSTISAIAQYNISGKVMTDRGKPVVGASVYLDNTIDGGTTDSAGNFKFSTSEKGMQTVVVNAIGFSTAGKPLEIKENVSNIEFRLKSTAHELESVTVTAGSFEASNERDKTVLKPLDIVTTAGANADIVKAIQTLPGTQQQGTQTGLFVRGGDASEAAIVVDELIAQSAFFTTAPGVAARSRFSPFQFKGIAFSSGGYSARYGQALSSILELNSLDLPEKSNVTLGLNMAGIYAAGTKVQKNNAIEGTAYYNNLQPFYGIANTNFDFYNVPKGGGASTKYTWKPNKDGILKVLVNYAHFESGTQVPSPYVAGEKLRFGIKNDNGYATVSFRQQFTNKWTLYTAASYSANQDDVNYSSYKSLGNDDRLQYRAEGKFYAARRLSILVGGEWQGFGYSKQYDTTGYSHKFSFMENQIAAYAEADWAPVYWLALKPGIRYEQSTLLNKNNIAPRFAMAIRAGQHGQFSLAGGTFYQLPDITYLLYSYRPNMQEAIHYIANYQWMKSDRTFRVEAYYKDYKQLVRELTTNGFDPNSFRTPYGTVNNSGYGYAKGLELFLRDKKSIKNLDYWISYSYIDTRRLYKNYTAEATPDFISDHNLNVITKYYVDKWHTQFNVSYGYASGRPYYNPNRTGDANFMTDRTPDYHNFSITVNYLRSVKKWFTVIYAGIDNITNQHNVFGYRYSADGTQRYAQVPALYRSFFIGINMSLSEFNKDEL